MGESEAESWELALDVELEWDLTRLIPWDGVMERDLVGEDAVHCRAVKPVGEGPLLGGTLSEPAPSRSSANFWVRRLMAWVSVIESTIPRATPGMELVHFWAVGEH